MARLVCLRSMFKCRRMVDQPVDILKIIAKLSPAVVEQVIDVPKIIQDTTPQRLEPSEPRQLVEQLGWKCQCPRLTSARAWPSSVTAVAAGGACSRGLSLGGTRGGSWGTEQEQENPPPGTTASPGRYINTGQG